MNSHPNRFATVKPALWRQAPALILFSCLVNLLLLVTAIYMLQVYDRVLSSGSLDTLMWLTVAALATLAIYGVLEQARRTILGRIGSWLDGELTEPVIRRSMEARLTGIEPGCGPKDVSDLRGFFAGDGILAFLDAPWSLLFLAFIWSLHPALGLLATGGAVALFGLAVANELLTRAQQQQATKVLRATNSAALRFIEGGETIAPLGMADAIFGRWRRRHDEARGHQQSLEERTTTILSLSRVLRLTLQIGVLGVGAYYVLDGQITAGAMIASSIIMGRALAPIERSIGAWRRFVAARAAYANLTSFFHDLEDRSEPVRLPRPRGKLVVENANVLAPTHEPILRNVTFSLSPGETCAIVGASGSGKSSLCRLLVGAWRPHLGHVRLDGADVFAWDAEDLGRYIGYLPQQLEFFAGTVAENIARFQDIDSQKVVRAARLAGVHELVLSLPDGYETDVGTAGGRLSQGQRQRIGLARAVYGDPQFIVLDEPNSNLDSDGDQALGQTLDLLKREGRTIIIVTHRSAALQTVDKILVLRDGTVARFGNRADVLKPTMETGQTVPATMGSGGFAALHAATGKQTD